jgi:hypothetical protein
MRCIFPSVKMEMFKSKKSKAMPVTVRGDP